MRHSMFLEDQKKFITFIERFGTNNEIDIEQEDGYLCIVVQPWSGTAVPWFAVALALFLKKSGKKNVTILFDDLCFGDDESFFQTQIKAIGDVLENHAASIPNYRLSRFENDVYPIDQCLIDTMSSLNSLHKMRGETNAEKRFYYEQTIKKQYEEIYRAQCKFLDALGSGTLVLPGGIWGSSGLLTKLAQERFVQVMSYDSGEGVLLFSTNGVASQLTDIAVSFEIILKSDDRNMAIQKGMEQLVKRREGSDRYRHFDARSSEDRYRTPFYLMLLNSVWDSAALGLHTVYDSMLEWIIDSIRWVLNHTDKTVVIRQHPAERDVRLDNTDNYEHIVAQLFSNEKRVIFIHARDEVNTYSLIEQSAAVLGFSSTSIVEAVALGKPAVIVSKAYYSTFGIVNVARNKHEYYDLLKKADMHMLDVSDEMRERAYICNYITQTCNWIQTSFTPMPKDFRKWVEGIDESEVDILITAIAQRIPAALYQHQRFKNELM